MTMTSLKKSPCTVAVIGCGEIGLVHIRTVLRLSHSGPRGLTAKLLYIVSRSEQHARDIADQINRGIVPTQAGTHQEQGLARSSEHSKVIGLPLSRLSDVLADPALDAVIVATPSETHEAIVRSALQAGKAVFCEKPLSMATGKDAAAKQEPVVQSLFALAKAKGLPLLVGFNRRFDPSFANLQAALERGEVGDAEVIRISSRDPAGEGRADWVDKNAVFDSLIHDLDMLHWICGRKAGAPKTVHPIVSRERRLMSVGIQYENGALAALDFADCIEYGYDQRLEVFGSKGILQVDNEKRSTLKVLGASGTNGALTPQFYYVRYQQAYENEIVHFLDALVNGTPLLVTEDDCIAVARMADRIFESLQSVKSASQPIPPSKRIPSVNSRVFGGSGKSKVKVCLVGAGRMGAVRAPSISSHPDTTLHSIVDVAFDRAQELARLFGEESTKCYASLEEALQDTHVDAVWISTPTMLHKDAITVAARFKKPIYCEKPIALSASETDECYRIAKEAGVPLMCGWDRRFDPSLRRLKNFAHESSSSGNALIVRSFIGDHPLPPTSIIIQCGSIFHDLAVHDIDFSIWLMGGERPSSVFAMGSAFVPEIREANLAELKANASAHPVLDSALVFISFPSGRISIVQARRVCHHGYDQRFEMLGTKGVMLTVNNIPETFTTTWGKDAIVDDRIVHSFNGRYVDAHGAECQHLAGVVRGQEEPLTTHEESKLVALVCDAAIQSFSSGRPVEVPSV